MVHHAEKVPIGRTGLYVSRLGLGTAALGYLYEPVSTEQAVQTVRAAFSAGVNFFDTAPLYGKGLAEQRLGEILPQLPRDAFVLATKVGYAIPDEPGDITVPAEARDYSYDGVMRSFEASLRRLRVDRVDILHIHDPDFHYAEAMAGAYKALRELKRQGLVRAIGAGMNQSAMLTRFAEEGEFDCFLLAGRYTLLDQSALADLMPLAAERGISIFIGGPLNSGILADPWAERPMFNYAPAPAAWVEKARRLDTVCKRFGVPLKAAALQFPLAHPAVASVLTGARSEAELAENIEMLRTPVPVELWSALKREGLLPEAAPTPH
ncbi:aldo/keto reductase [Alicyclobacillus cellulosilyticus]|uniref:aldo/keto reductase n=1 Tax=Alicyclobacillus cellulosilyticus TaxID=1003997 RepID=UPI001E49128B|nr:aldo/keto reductase [Alicyclobacillus cellulosilyticus]